MGVTAPALTYDNLPARSALLREAVPGGIIITSAAREPDRHARAAARHDTAGSAAVITAVILLPCLGLFGAEAWAHRSILPSWTALVAGVFCVALFAFVWQLRSTTRISALARALSQNTILVARRGQLLIESSGPLGTLSLDIPRSQVRDIRVVKKSRSRRDDENSLPYIELELADSRWIGVLPGHDLHELNWVKRALDAACQTNPQSGTIPNGCRP